MRFEHSGMVLWYGTADAPAPGENVLAGSEATVTIAVTPIDPTNTVGLLYRVNQGQRQTVPACSSRTDLPKGVQYFVARLPAFWPGDLVEYIGTCRSWRGQVPSPEDVTRLPSSFRVALFSGLEGASPGSLGYNEGRSAHMERTLGRQSGRSRSARGENDALPLPDGADARGSSNSDAARERLVSGRVVSMEGQPASGVVVRAYQRVFGGGESRLGETTTDAQGAYAIPYKYAGTTNIELRAVGSQGKEVPLSKTRFGAQDREEFNVVAPAAVVPKVIEFEQLRTDLAKEVSDLKALASAVESADRQDFSALHAATGWDTRLISLAAMAEKHSTDTGISSDLLYAAFRAGLPTDLTQLALLGSDTFSQALRSARDASVVSLDDGQLAKAKQSYDSFARASRRTLKAAGALSTFADLLSRSGLSEKEVADFEDVYFAPRSAQGDLWKAAREKGLSESKVNTLRLQGKLAALTLNNAALVESLRARLSSPDKLGILVETGFYEARVWKEHLIKLGASTLGGLEQIVPPAYVGDSLEERVSNYAEDLARKVRQSFPTKVVAQRIAADEFVLPDHARVKGPVTRVLRNAEDKGIVLELGKTPISAALRKNGAALLEGVSTDDRPEAEKKLKLLQRLYQVTPSDHALGVLLSIGIGSASEIAALRLDEFLRRYGERFCPGEAELVHSKCVQVSHVVFNAFVHAQQVLSPSSVYVLSATPAKQQEAAANLRAHFPTLETLFGSLDYCECEQCRSVLSPAAYLVDLLQFLDPSDFEWGTVLSKWQKEKRTDYPYAKPYDVLTSRRPELPHVALTCENTNTALPYIDVVNEVLEYYVGNGKLDAEAARDTGDIASADLISEPRFITESAYDRLAEQIYPLTLPFDLWSETARRFLSHFDISYSELLETFRRSDDLFSTSAEPKDFGYSSVFLEQLGLSPAEAAPLTDATLIQNEWWGLFGYGGWGLASAENSALAELSSIKTLSRKLGVSYEELVALVRTWFVNPELDSLVTLKKLDLDITDILRLKGQPGYSSFSPEEQTAFNEKLTKAKDKFAFDASQWIDARWQAGDFKNVVLLADTTGECDFSTTILRFADGRAIDKVVLVRLNLLVRLWRRLGWALDELDQALRIFVPSGQSGTAKSPPGTLQEQASALKSLLIYFAHLKTLVSRLAVGTNSVLRLLTFWGPVATRGGSPLYAQLFLTPSVLTNDAIFDSPLGSYLSQPGQLLRDHLPAVQGAIGMTAADIELVVQRSGQSLDAAPLSLDNISLILRHAVLAKGLKVSIPELMGWIRLSGINPFEALAVDPLAAVEDDRPFTHTLWFIDFVTTVREAGLRLADAAYAVLHEFDALGPHRERPDLDVALLRNLSASLERLAVEHAVPNDINAFSDEVLRQKLALVAPPDIVDTFLGMWKRSPPPAGSASTDSLPQIAFDAQKARVFLEGSFPGLFGPGDEAIFNPTTAEVDRRQRAAEVLLPFIQRRESRRQIAQMVAAQLESDEALVDALLNDAMFLADPSVSSGGAPLIESYLPAVARGVTVSYFAAGDLSGSTVQAPTTAATPDIQDAPSHARSVRVEGLIEVPAAGGYRFFVVAEGVGPEVVLQLGSGSTAVVLGKLTAPGQELEGRTELKAGALIPFRLEIRGLAGGFNCSVEGPNLARGPLNRAILRPQAVLERLARAQLLVSKVLGLANGLALSEREVRYIAGHADTFEAFEFSKLPLDKQALNPVLSASVGRQVAALCEYVRCRQVLSVSSDEMAALLDRMARVINTPADIDGAKRKLLGDVCDALASAMRRPASSVARLVEHFGLEVTSASAGAGISLRIDELAVPATLHRVLRGLELASRIGVSIETLVGATPAAGAVGTAGWAQPIPPPSVTPNPGPQIARGIRDAVRALYDTDTWRRVAQPISDKLRQRKRDALVAYVMHTGDFPSMEEMFQFFLLDPGMEPVVYTSRIQLAISSVQTFIQRCFLNLESQPPQGQPTLAVPPSALDADHWLWMKRYRIWEANRKIFLFPENWLEPEFRDDKSYLFEELESALLQGDVSDDLVEAAFLKYLNGLNEIARLEVVSCSADEQRGTLHVLARTYNLAGRKYFYRKNVWGSWFPWEPVGADIQGDHVIPVVWRKRLHLFWVSFMEKGIQPELKNKDGSIACAEQLAKQPVADFILHGLEAQLHWVERVGDKWTARSSSPQLDLSPTTTSKIDLSKVTIHAETSGAESGPVLIHLGGEVKKALRLASKNGVPTIIPAQPAPALAFSTSGYGPTYRWGTGALEVKGFAKRQMSTYGVDVHVDLQDITILGKDDGAPPGRDGGTFELIAPAHRVLSAAVSGDTNRTPLFRLYHPSVVDHFYTTSENERDFAINLGYQYEGIVCEVARANDPGRVPLYRLYSPATGDHFYTTSAEERKDAQAIYGYTDEGVACYVPSGGDTVPLYRAVHLSEGDHFYTTSLAEKNNAIEKLGFKYEGVACAVFPPRIGAEELQRLTTPVFYRDSRQIFFIDPSVEETAFDKWDGWAVPLTLPDPQPWKPVPIVSQKPFWPPMRWPVETTLSPEATFNPIAKGDWLANEKTILVLGDRGIGGKGSFPTKELVARNVLGADSLILRGAATVGLSPVIGENLRIIGSQGTSTLPDRVMTNRSVMRPF